MQMIKVSSSNVDEVGYDSSTQTLQIKFLSGTTFQYLNVPQMEHENLIQAPSIGSYFNRNIRNQYPYERIG